MHGHRLAFTLLLVCLSSSLALAQPGPSEVSSLTQKQFSLFRDQLQLTPSYDIDAGSFKLVVAGEVLWPLPFLSHEPPSTSPGTSIFDLDPEGPVFRIDRARVVYLGFQPDASVTMQKTSPNFVGGTVSLDISWNEREVVGQPAKWGTRPTGRTIAALSVELQKRKGDYPGKKESDPLTEVDQTIVGLRGLYQPRIRGQAPLQLTATYFVVDDRSPNPATLPPDITSDRLQLRAQFEHYLSWDLGRLEDAFGIKGETRLTLPTKSAAANEFYGEISLLVRVSEEFKVAASYRTGENLGFDFDKEVLLGAIWKAFGK